MTGDSGETCILPCFSADVHLFYEQLFPSDKCKIEEKLNYIYSKVDFLSLASVVWVDRKVGATFSFSFLINVPNIALIIHV